MHHCTRTLQPSSASIFVLTQFSLVIFFKNFIFFLDLPPSLLEYMNPESPQDPPQLKVIGVGLGRTGTASLSVALEKLGFGPCFHSTRYTMSEVWFKKCLQAIKEGDASPKLLHELYRGFESAVELTYTMAESMYKSYPNAKFILTVRDPAKHAQSWENAVIPSVQVTRLVIDTLDSLEPGSELPNRVTLTEKYGRIVESPEMCRLYKYIVFENDGQLKRPNILQHNERMIQLIPKEKLLIFDVSAGWRPLVEFLGVPEPNEPFPRINDTKAILERLALSTPRKCTTMT